MLAKGSAENQDDVVENCRDLGIIVAGDQVVGELNRVLGVRDLACVQPAIDVNDRLALPGKLPRFFVGKPLRVGEP